MLPERKYLQVKRIETGVYLFLQESDVFYIPTSGLSGENLATRSSVAQLTSWYSGPSLLEQIGNVHWQGSSCPKHLLPFDT